ncbi:hypothetical protein BS17DRAFT_786343 [Gyrodon lividus]|nr:hypothetical protein BS17DRAFT_786343 [Gyrodon lividus]
MYPTSPTNGQPFGAGIAATANKASLTLYRCNWGVRSCGKWIEGNSTSIRAHIRDHGVVVKDGERTHCRWGNCGMEVLFSNVARHVMSQCHLGIRMGCSRPLCGFTATREYIMEKHRNDCEPCAGATTVTLHGPGGQVFVLSGLHLS